MLLPKANTALVEVTKVTDYLLSETHPVGRQKARFFNRLGYEQNQAEVLRTAILEIAKKCHVAEKVDSAFGTKYVVYGTLQSPLGISAPIKTIWIIEKGDTKPRFVTAYPNE